MLASLLLAIPLASAGRLSGPDVAMIALLVLASFDAVGGLAGAYRALGQTLAAARRIFEIVDAEPAVREPAREAARPSRFDIAFNHVSLRYDEDGAWALRDVSLHIPEGGALGIIGPTGSGKTSLGNVLLRFWQFQEGEILLGGVPIRDLSGETMRGLCAVISQQTHLFNTSIRENLRIARPQATDTEMEQALRDAGILGEVRAMPDGHTAFRRAGAARRDRPRLPERRADPHPGRADRGAGRLLRTRRRRCAGAIDAGPHDPSDQSSPKRVAWCQQCYDDGRR
jgi:ATP-binding cassette subfamily C protein CydC